MSTFYNYIIFISNKTKCNTNYTMSGSGEGDYALGENGQEMFCTSNKAKFVFDDGFDVDILYLWYLVEQCRFFEDILVDVGSIGAAQQLG